MISTGRHWERSASRTRYPDRPEPGDPRYARRDRHDLSHRSRPPVGAPAERSIPDPIRALLARGAQPRGSSARWSQAFAPRGAGLSFGSIAWPNVSRPRERLRRRGVKIRPEPNFGVGGIMSIPERAFLAFGCRRASDGGAPFWSHGSLLSGSRRARHRRRSETSVLSRSTRLSGAAGSGRSPIEIAACRPPRAEKRNRAARCVRPSPPTPRRAKRARRSLTSAATRLPSLDATFP